MTHNQIDRYNAIEGRRHNTTTETETMRHNIADESIRSEANVINREHYERSDYNAARANEISAEHYANQDYVSKVNAQENIRHNKTSERLTKQLNNETIRHNVVSENLGWSNLSENVRHNMQTESIGALNANASIMGASAAMTSASAALSNAYENIRHNTEMEDINRSSNDIARLNALTSSAQQQNQSDVNRDKAEAEIGLNQERAQTEFSQRALNWAKTINTYINSINAGIDTVQSIMGGASKPGKAQIAK